MTQDEIIHMAQGYEPTFTWAQLQAALALLAHWDTPAWKYLKPTGDLIADLREALGENNGKRTMDGNSEYNVAGGNDDCSCIGNDQEPVIDLSKLRHEDKCRYWDDERFCDCGADSHELLKWYRKNAAPVRTKDLTDDEIMKINVDTASIVPTCDRQFHFARAVIAADREKNRA